MITDRDYIMRLARRLAEFVARVMGLKKAGQHQQALDEIAQTAGEMLEVELDALDAVDVRSAALLLKNDSGKVEIYARLLELKADILVETGDLIGAGRRRTRAEALRALALPPAQT